MKNLKKIIIVIAMLALLVASFVTVVGAEEDANAGKVSKLEEYITAIKAEIDKGEAGDPTARISDAYTYLRDTKIVWAEDVVNSSEYKNAVATIDGYCVQVANALCDAIPEVNEENAETAVVSINEVYAFVAGCAPAETTDGYATLKENLGKKNEVITEAKFAAIKVPGEDSEDVYADTNSARVAVKELFKQLNKCPWVSADASLKYNDKANELVTFMINEYDKFIDALKNTEGNVDVATISSDDYFKIINDIRTAEDLAYSTGIYDDDAYAETIAKLHERIISADEAIEVKRQALDSLAPFAEYDLGYYTQNKFEGDEKVLEGYNQTGTNKVERGAESIYTKVGTNPDGTPKYDYQNNGYTKFVYGNGDKSHLYTAIKVSDATLMKEYGIVFEWDIRINETVKEPIVFQDEDRIRVNSAGNAVFKNLFSIGSGDSNFATIKIGAVGDYSIVTNYDTKAAYEKAMVVDVWTHFTMTFNPETRIGALYVNYEKVLDIYHFTHEKLQSQFRVGPSSQSDWAGWDVDNVELYYGTAFRITDKFSSMTKTQQFDYYVNYAAGKMDNENEYLARDNAYDKAKMLAKDFAGTETWMLFDSISYDDDIKYPAMNQNLGILTEKVWKLNPDNEEWLAPITENITKINNAITEIKAFVNKNAVLIDKADSINKDPETGEKLPENRYQTQMNMVYEAEANVKKLEVLKTFVDALKKFERSTTLSALTRYAAQAAEIYAKAEYDIEENRDFVAKDPIVVDFEKMINGQKVSDGVYLKPTDEKGNATPGYKAEDDPTYIQIFEYYDSFASRLSEREKLENAKNIINAMNSVTEMDGYEATDAFFEANYDAINSYTLLVRGYINNGNYDKAYPGVAEALQKFYEMDPYFYEMLQREHVATLTEMVAKYYEVNTLIEKVAVVNSVKAYFENEDTALNNTTITKAVRMRIEDEREALLKLQNQNDVYEEELKGYDNPAGPEGYGESYLEILAQQTEYFINIINHMDSVISFAEIEELFADATVYYYGINLNAEGALEAAEKYADYRAYIASVKANNEAFAMYMKDLNYALNCDGVEKRDEMFSALKNLGVYADFVDAGNKNVAKQLEIYYEALAEYESGIVAIESAIYEASQFGNALRTNKLPATVLSVIGKLINN